MNSIPSLPSPSWPKMPSILSRATLAASLAALAFSHSANAADVIIWNFATATPSSAPVANLTVSALSRGNNNPENGSNTLFNATSVSNYTGASGSTNAGAAARAGVLSIAIDGSAYFEFSLTPQNGASVTITEFKFGSRSTGTGPTTYSIRSSADGYGANIATGTTLANSAWALNTNSSLSVNLTTARTFRIYGHGGGGSPSTNTSNWRIDDLAVAVTVTGGATESLTLSLAPSTLVETGSPSVSTATVTRTGSTASALTVNIAVSDATVATAPLSVVIPATSASTTFQVAAFDDSIADGDQTANVTVSAASFVSDTKVITVQNDGDTPPLVINEVMAAPTVDTSGDGVFEANQDEFVELVNKTIANLDISGWTVADNAQVRFTFPASTILLPGQAVVVFGGGTGAPTIFNALAFRIGGSGLGLNNTGGDSVTIRDNSNILVTSMSFGATQAASFNLSPEATFGSPYVVHTAVTNAVGNFSPGRKADTTEFISLSPLTLTLLPASITEFGGVTTSTGTVTRPGPTTTALTVSISSSNINKATVAATTVEIPIGSSSADFTITSVDNIEPDGSINVSIFAAAIGFSGASATLTVVSDADSIPPSTLAPGAIAFTGFNADATDDFAFVALVAIPAGTKIRFTDNEWNGEPLATTGIFNTGEGFMEWTAVETLAAGTVVEVANASDVATVFASSGTVAGTVNFNATDETCYAYQGTQLRASGFLAVVATHTGDSIVGTGLTSGTTAIYLQADADIAAYIGSRSSQSTFAGYLTLIADTEPNWIYQDTGLDDSNDGIAPDIGTLGFDKTAFTLTSGGNTYAAWATANATTGALATADHDNDGTPNGVEYFMGATGSTFTPNPSLGALNKIIWPKSPTFVGSFTVQTSPNLVTWTDEASTVVGNTVEYTLTGPGPKFVRMKVVP